MKHSKLIKNNNGFTLIELLASITILSIILLSFMNYFIQASTYTSYNQEKTVAVNVARNVMMFMEKQNYLQMRDRFESTSVNQPLEVLICGSEGYNMYPSSETPDVSCSPITINNDPFEVVVYQNGEETEESKGHYLPIQVEVRWDRNGNSESTTVEGTIKSEDLR
ncbi:type IV pilus modification PilV family protein [Bacillus coahuilensis]|uniref:type IV pilus modification PilV family protein n=1 Tax=Bacillus coahuilensis TaxID=408580 RepID=UPI0001850831|nr:type II secretion system protein [Bacillus coahuilensis]